MKNRILSVLALLAVVLIVFSGCRKGDPYDVPTAAFSNPDDYVTTGVVSTLPRIFVGNGELTIFLSVTDQIGNPLTGLNQYNFMVEMINDNGVQLIDNFVLNSTGGTGTPSNIAAALTLDFSGSMHVDSADIPNMRNAVNTFIDLKGSSDLLEIIKFDHNVQTVQTFTNDTGLLHTAVNDDTSFTFGGSTAFYNACLTGVYDADDTVSNLTGYLPAVVGFTDGKNNQWPIQPDTLVQTALTAQVPVYTVAYGSFTGSNAPDTAALQFLADTTGGRYFFTPTSAGLQTLYQYINGQLTNMYVITFPFGSKDNATIKVTTSYTCGNGPFKSSASKMIWY